MPQVAAKSNAPLAVCFNLVDSFNSAGKRQFGWMLKGLKEVMSPLLSRYSLRSNMPTPAARPSLIARMKKVYEGEEEVVRAPMPTKISESRMVET